MKVGISEAAKLAGLSRQHFYTKYLNTGVVSVDKSTPHKPAIDISELLRVFPGLVLPDIIADKTGHMLTPDLSSVVTGLQQELTSARKQLQDSQDREKWLQQHADKLADTIKLLEHKDQHKTAEPVQRWWRLKLW